ncbi:hypothetical protein Nepgr_002251 [Nepenthes gracilis]|uniref:Embryo defective 1703 n=1 Tax=Nepenthes gracilis TaxID=150966 RepID=A0AAD3P9R6_NEPGR|nr:hypothetical protein Nepgr_002251 [Nepenthes gracilis]
MEGLTASISTKLQHSFGALIFFRKSSFITIDKNPCEFRKLQFKYHPMIPFWTNLPLPKRKNLHISAHLRRPTNRRNSLRKKVADNSQVRQTPTLLDRIPTSTENVNIQSNFGTAIGEQGSESSQVNEIVPGDNLAHPKRFSESKLWDKLDSWVEQNKQDIDSWGVGSSPIFTVLQNSYGNVKRVVVDEDEILRRSGLEPAYYREQIGFVDFSEVNSKISNAKVLAGEIECGKYVLPKNSSVAKFVISGDEKSRFVNGIDSILTQPTLVSTVSKLGIASCCVFLFVWAVKKVLHMRSGNTEFTRLEKEMIRRKKKSRMEKEKLKKGSVEVVQNLVKPLKLITERPKLSKDELMNSIKKAKAAKNELAMLDISPNQETISIDMDCRIQEIRRMARRTRKVERGEHSPIAGDEEREQLTSKDSSSQIEAVGHNGEEIMDFPIPVGASKTSGVDDVIETAVLDDPKNDHANFSGETVYAGNMGLQLKNAKSSHDSLNLLDSKKEVKSPNISSSHLSLSKKVVLRTKPRVILSVNEAREYLSQKHGKQVIDEKSRFSDVHEESIAMGEIKKIEGLNNDVSQRLDDAMVDLSGLSGISDPSPAVNACEDSHLKENESLSTGIFGLNRETQITTVQEASASVLGSTDCSIVDTERRLEIVEKVNETFKLLGSGEMSGLIPTGSGLEERICIPVEKDDQENFGENSEAGVLLPDNASEGSEKDAIISEVQPFVNKEKWLEKNFHELEPVVEKIGAGFRDSYKAAREKLNQELDGRLDYAKLGSIVARTELEWMNDDKLREIVLKVRDNELSGQDPFHLVDAEDKIAFFKGLETIVEKENKKLSALHEWLHSNIENLDYGAEGISLYDPPEKVVPRWKGPPIDEFLDFLINCAEQQKSSSPQEANELPLHQRVPTSQEVSSMNSESQDRVSRSSKTVIETSDGSIKPGRKSGKEYWEHTKKWSPGFLESYNAEQDPEVKAVMRDIGKDLDRWITEKEMQEAADLMDKMPQRNREFVEKKLNKLKREMELFGPQAVVNKYSEYAEEKEEDYLWWLDLPYVLCIELYTYDGEELKVGFYSLEMAEDLELDPKPHHVIAFENPNDSKNLCYIIQAHMEMLGNGKAFVVAQPPKDVFREAKANGFGVTVIRRGELELNVDQPLEEVEEKIVEIGSKMYHDKITRERSIDLSSLMKGVFGVSKPIKRRKSRRRLDRPRKH